MVCIGRAGIPADATDGAGHTKRGETVTDEHATAERIVVRTVEDLYCLVETTVKAQVLDLRPERPLASEIGRQRLPNSELWSCAYGLPVCLRFGETDHLRVQLHQTGAGMTRIGQRTVPIVAAQGCIAQTQAEIDFPTDFRQLAWRIAPQVLGRKLVALTGQPLSRKLEFEHELNLDSPDGAALLATVQHFLALAGSPATSGAGLVLAELEQALMVALLCASTHNHRHALTGVARGAAPWQVRRAEAYIEANWNRPLSLEDIVGATGASARSIFRTFRESRGYSPYEFLREVRLRHARHMLENADPTQTVTGTALACGFSDLAGFSREYSRAFGESPSAVLRRSRSRIS
jgi:AraC-like DNA-binding protein